MALSASTIWEVWTTGDDTNGGGAFDPSQTGGMFTDGAATSANTASPVFTSASYNFAAGDVGAWVYLSSGTTGATVAGGWYKIASVAANAATLSAAIGAGVLKTVLTPTTVIGCANGASPTVITWTIDYSQQAAARYTYTDLASAGTGLTVSSAAKPFAKEQVGNSLVITGGTNFNAGRYVIASVAAGVATVVGPTNITTLAGVNGTGSQGGALASPGLAGAVVVSGNFLFIKSGAYSITTASTNVTTGCFSPATLANGMIQGYGSVRGDLGTMPVFTATGSISTFVIFNVTGNDATVINISGDGSSYTSSRVLTCARAQVYKVYAANCSNGGISIVGAAIACRVTGCTSVTALTCTVADGCESYSNTSVGITAGIAMDCISINNSGASSDGFNLNNPSSVALNCVAYNNGRDGFRGTFGATFDCAVVNCIAEAHTASGARGFSIGTNSQLTIINCAGFNNNTANSNGSAPVVGYVTLTASPFTNAAAGDFSLNNTAGGGAACRAAGFPALFPAGLTASYQDIGAAQHLETAGGGYVPIIME